VANKKEMGVEGEERVADYGNRDMFQEWLR
jgi:hypothetical protein